MMVLAQLCLFYSQDIVLFYCKRIDFKLNEAGPSNIFCLFYIIDIEIDMALLTITQLTTRYLMKKTLSKQISKLFLFIIINDF